MVSSKQAGNPASYQRSINHAIRKVIGSSNRGFASMDPERQRGDFTHSGDTTRESGNAHEFSSQQDRDPAGRSGSGGGSTPAGGTGAQRGKATGQ